MICAANHCRCPNSDSDCSSSLTITKTVPARNQQAFYPGRAPYEKNSISVASVFGSSSLKELTVGILRGLLRPERAALQDLFLKNEVLRI